MGDQYDSSDAAAERDPVSETAQLEDERPDEIEDDPFEDDWDYDAERGVWW